MGFNSLSCSGRMDVPWSVSQAVGQELLARLEDARLELLLSAALPAAQIFSTEGMMICPASLS